MKRLHRLTAILIKFQSSKSIKVKELAKSYNVSTRTIYRDIKALEEAGVPIGYEPGENYFLLEGYQLPPIHFTQEESQAVVTARALVNQNSDSSLTTHFNKAVAKVIAVLKSLDRKNSLELEQRIAPSVARRESHSAILITVQKCITNFQYVNIGYKSGNGAKTNRDVRPLALYFTQDHWIMVAYCTLRKAQREFRLDRIERLETLEHFFAPNQFSLDDYFKKYS